MKLPRFMLAQNHLAKTVDQFVLHARKPAFIARVITADIEVYKNVKPYFQIGRTNSILELIEVYQEGDPDIIVATLEQMAEWYFHSHLKTKL